MLAAPTGTTNDLDPRERLEALLAESVEAAQQREAAAFDELAAPCEQRLVLFGAGGLGKRTLAGLRKIGLQPVAFADNNQALWGQLVDGVPILSPKDAAARFGRSAAFLVTIWNGRLKDRTRDRVRQLTDLGCRRVVPVGFLFWKYPDAFLPFYPLDLPHKVLLRAAEVRSAFRLWQDDLSRREYVAQVAFRLLLDFDGMSAPAVSQHYFPTDVYRLTQNEVFIDCGAFDGDTIKAFVNRMGDRFARIIAYEPDPANWRKLQRTINSMPVAAGRKIACVHQAVGAASGTVQFNPMGTELSAAGSGHLEVPCVALDESLGAETPTIIKFDIEGAELGALAGARHVIQRSLPVLAVSAYHRQADLWDVPLAIAAISGDYRFFLRPHEFEGWDLVCYAAPSHRVAAED